MFEPQVRAFLALTGTIFWGFFCPLWHLPACCVFLFIDSIISQFIDQTTVLYQYYARGDSHYVISDFLCLLVPKIL